MAKKRKAKKAKAKRAKAKKTKVKRTQAKKAKVKRKGMAKINEPERQPTQSAGTPEHTVTDVPPTPTILGPKSATDL
jgi:hypothetical protein